MRPPFTPLTPAEETQFFGLLDSGFFIHRAAQQIGYTKDTASIRHAVDKWRKQNNQIRKSSQDAQTPEETISEAQDFTETGETAFAVSDPSLEFRTLDAFLGYIKPDFGEWSMTKHVINNWSQNWQIKVWFERRAGYSTALNLQALKAELIEEVTAAAPERRPRAYPQHGNGHLAVMHIPDLHIGKAAASFVREDWGIEGATLAFGDAVDNLLHRVRGFEIERVLFVLGSDMMHTDSKAGTTTGGTGVQPTHDQHAIFRAARLAATEAILRCLEVAPVDVIVIPGNHDHNHVIALGEAIEARFHHDPDVRVDNSDYARKYYDYGENLFGFSHGDKVKASELPGKMATEVPQLWGQCRHREFQIGHTHTKKAVVVQPIQEIAGTLVRSLSSLAPLDTWHDENGYTGNTRAAECFVYDPEDGLVGSSRYVLR